LVPLSVTYPQFGIHAGRDGRGAEIQGLDEGTAITGIDHGQRPVGIGDDQPGRARGVDPDWIAPRRQVDGRRCVNRVGERIDDRDLAHGGVRDVDPPLTAWIDAGGDPEG
jgi:hypothetical protein